jgi:hypothetical protein
MINHKYKIIFIHIPKCAGTSISNLLFDTKNQKWKVPNYDIHYGWCPKRKIHMQHATPNQLLELGLIDESIWNNYLKFTVVRNPWSRAESGYKWLRKTYKIRDSFENYITKSGKFKAVMTDNSNKRYRGDHLNKQMDYLNVKELNNIDRVLRFENIQNEINSLLKDIELSNLQLPFYKKRKNKKKHYSHFYDEYKKSLIDKYFADDIDHLNYEFIDKKSSRKIFNRIRLHRFY